MDKKRPVEGAAEGNDPPVVIDKKMEMVIDKMFDRCFSDKKYKHVIGIALESRRLDKVKQAIELSGDAIEDNLGYTFNLAQKKLSRGKNSELKSSGYCCSFTKTEMIKAILIITKSLSVSFICRYLRELPHFSRDSPRMTVSSYMHTKLHSIFATRKTRLIRVKLSIVLQRSFQITKLVKVKCRLPLLKEFSRF